MKAYIKAIEYFLPNKILTNQEISNDFPEWTEEKIEKKLGIIERHVTSNGETASDIAFNAASKLIDSKIIDKNDIDCLILCTQSPDYFLPTTACILQDRLGMPKSVAAFDVNLGCSGWIYGLSLAKAFVVSQMHKNVLLLTAETYSKYLHSKDKGNRTIFGDGAAATLVSNEGIAEIGEFIFGTDGSGAENLIVKSGAHRHKEPYNDLEYDDFDNPKSSDHIYMNGTEILNYTLDVIPSLVREVLHKNNVTLEDIDLHVYHQANKYIANLQRKKLKIDPGKYYHCYQNSGNTVSSTIPIALKEALNDNTVKSNTKVLSVAQGLGYSWGVVYLHFNNID